MGLLTIMEISIITLLFQKKKIITLLILDCYNYNIRRCKFSDSFRILNLKDINNILVFNFYIILIIFKD